ncbi:MAG: alpha-1,2-mannosyltransferase [Natronomonas sp.]|jgi:alpha-1,2-mannosyltransferase|uniref:glycosyltransferase family 87 protein n=1 Tax=Natronomonas sp. TaxID=2184060 RepID=UPI00398A3654
MSALHALLALRQRRPRFVAGSLAALGFLLSYPAIHWWLNSLGIAGEFGFYDFGVYRTAVAHWEAGEALYVPNEDGGYHGSYLYPPVFVLLFVPLSDMAFRQAAIVWNAVSVALLWVGLQALVATYRVRLAWYERGLLLWAILGFQPVILSMRLGQVSVFLAGLLAVALAAMRHAENGTGGPAAQYASGALTAVPGTMKLIFAPAGAHLLQNRRRFAGAVGMGLTLLVVSVAVFGVDSHRAYLDVLAWGKGWGESRDPRLWGVAYYRPLYVIGATASLVVRFALAALISVLALLTTDEGLDSEVFALGVAAIPFIAPRAYTQDLAIFLPVVVVLIASELSRNDGGRPLVPVIGLWLAAVHAYGLYALVNVLPGRVPGGAFIAAHAGYLQPGLWATLLLMGLPLVRVIQATNIVETLENRFPWVPVPL